MELVTQEALVVNIISNVEGEGMFMCQKSGVLRLRYFGYGKKCKPKKNRKARICSSPKLRGYSNTLRNYPSHGQAASVGHISLPGGQEHQKQWQPWICCAQKPAPDQRDGQRTMRTDTTQNTTDQWGKEMSL